MEMHEIRIPIGCEGNNVSFENFHAFCEEFGCELHKKRRGDAEWHITSDDATNFFWLGMNLNFKHESPISISSASKYLTSKIK